MSAKAKFNARQLMEKAVAVMNQSVAEPRKDGKATPRAGAVLFKADGSIETASRGELRSGDHAEFTLLERKNRSTRLDGARLSATLEPCAPGARNHPKLSCAERIVLARIKEVWVGIEDPDPTVDRKGIKYLQDHGVTVQLSALESPAAHADLADFSTKALEHYRDIARIGDPVASDAFNRRLAELGLLQWVGKKLVPSGFGLLLFGKSPRDAMPQAGLLGTIHHADGREDKPRDFDGPQVFVPEEALQWLRDKLPDPIDRSAARRQEVNRLFFTLVREGIVNALVHRDYAIAGAKCQLIVTPDTVVIKSPGQPVPPITLEQLQSFSAPMLSRNPALHYVFGKMELAEERGLGLKTMRESAAQAGLPLPKYSWEAPYLVLTWYRSPAGALTDLSPQVFARLNRDERRMWQLMVGRESVTSPELMTAMGFDERKAQRVPKKLLDVGLIRRGGKGRATRYQVIRP